MHVLEGHGFAQKLPRLEPYKPHKWIFFLMPFSLGMLDSKYMPYSNVGQLSQTSIFRLKRLSSFEKTFSRQDIFLDLKNFINLSQMKVCQLVEFMLGSNFII
jgi:hypothetical protein